MPQVKFVEVLSYSSESQNHPAENLLKSDGYYKWKCKEGTQDKQSWVTLKLEKLVTINAIDIGNENSALIEVLVGREGVDFQVLLVASSFMTPSEARNGTNLNRVRIFDKEKLSKHTIDQKWDRIKVICTQPFAKNVQYGLSFIKLHSAKDDSANSEVKLGRFTLKEEDKSTSSITIGSFFSKRKEEKELSTLRDPGAALISNDKTSTADKKSNAPGIGFYQLKKTAKDDTNSSSSNKVGSPSLNTKASREMDKPTKDTADKKPRAKVSPCESSSKNNIVRKRKSRPFSLLMEDVTFVMSGYKNPQRSALRGKMLEMGATYEGDWDESCSHLICAFANTPKFQAVKGKGKIVSEKWIEDCHRKKIRLPWRRYNLEKNRNADESEEEIYAEETLLEKAKNETTLESAQEGAKDDQTSDADYEDTDDEIERLMKKGQKRKDSLDICSVSKKAKDASSGASAPAATSLNGAPDSDDDYDADTDIDEEIEGQKALQKIDTWRLPLPPLDDFFKGKVFFLYGSMEEVSRKKLYRYLLAHAGKVSNYMSEEVQYVLTEDTWDDNFEEALNENPSLQFVKPQWVWKCCDKKKFVPPQPYLVVPLV